MRFCVIRALGGALIAAVPLITALSCSRGPSDGQAPPRGLPAGASEAPSHEGAPAPSSETVDGEQGASATPQEPDLDQVAWVRHHALAFDTVEAGHGFDDLEPLREVVGDARIVALGEGTHGTREFFQMKHRLVEFLASEMGFTIFAIEANMPEAYRVNDYVQGGKGDPQRLIGGMYFWTWNTEEVLAMCEWMQEFNATGAGTLAFTGFDMQTPQVAMETVREFVADHEPGYADELDKVYARAAKIEALYGGPFGVVSAQFPVEEAAGKHVRYAGYIKTKDLEDGWAGLWWRADGPLGETLAFDNMAGTGPKGTTPWTRYEIELDVPEETTSIDFGLIMPGRGTAWFDSLVVELDDQPHLDHEAFDFDFERDELVGFHSGEGAYAAHLDDTQAHTGAQSLRLSRKAPTPSEEIEPAEGVQIAETVLEHLELARDSYVDEATGEEADWVIQNARLVLQAMVSAASPERNLRDQYMAENIAWLLEQDPEAKVVVWAHNGHVSRGADLMGSYLAQWFGDDYLPVAFATYQGEYYAMDGGDHIHELQSPPADSAEHILGASGLSRLILDLRTADESSSASGWLTKPISFRSIGALATNQQFYPQNLAESFDLLIFVHETHPAVQLSTKPVNAPR